MASSTPKPSETILAAANPTDALRLVAEYIDALYELQAAPQSDDGWETWGKDALVDGAEPEEEWKPEPGVERELAELEAELQGNADADESRVLRAKIELTRDKLQPPVELVDNEGEATETHYDDDGNAVVDLPKPTIEQIDARAELVGRIGLRDQYGDELGAQAEDSFVRGGPLLLYLSDREYVAGLPHDVKVAMVADVEQSSPREAQELARDLLKADTDEANDLGSVAERIQSSVESGTLHNAP